MRRMRSRSASGRRARSRACARAFPGRLDPSSSARWRADAPPSSSASSPCAAAIFEPSLRARQEDGREADVQARSSGRRSARAEREGSISLNLAPAISSGDSSWRAHSRLDSYSQAFSIATAACEARRDLLVLAREVCPAVLLRQVQVPVRGAPRGGWARPGTVRMGGWVAGADRGGRSAMFLRGAARASRMSTPRIPRPREGLIAAWVSGSMPWVTKRSSSLPVASTTRAGVAGPRCSLGGSPRSRWSTVSSPELELRRIPPRRAPGRRTPPAWARRISAELRTKGDVDSPMA